jgi:hypothetical protein
MSPCSLAGKTSRMRSTVLAALTVCRVLADHDDVGVLAEGRAQGRREGSWLGDLAVVDDGGALLVLAGGVLSPHARRIAELAARGRLPAKYGLRPYVEAGGLISYGADIIVVNLRAPKALGLTVPPSLLLRADLIGSLASGRSRCRAPPAADPTSTRRTDT